MTLASLSHQQALPPGGTHIPGQAAPPSLGPLTLGPGRPPVREPSAAPVLGRGPEISPTKQRPDARHDAAEGVPEPGSTPRLGRMEQAADSPEPEGAVPGPLAKEPMPVSGGNAGEGVTKGPGSAGGACRASGVSCWHRGKSMGASAVGCIGTFGVRFHWGVWGSSPLCHTGAGGTFGARGAPELMPTAWLCVSAALVPQSAGSLHHTPLVTGAFTPKPRYRGYFTQRSR